jgi:hypothetical protein
MLNSEQGDPVSEQKLSSRPELSLLEEGKMEWRDLLFLLFCG